MSHILIKGTFHVVGHSPDGDSIKFKAKNPARWDRIQADDQEKFEEALVKEDGVLQLRLQAIDALETHYSPTRVRTPQELKEKEKEKVEEKPDPGHHKQPAYLGQEATNEFLRLLGVKRVEWRRWGNATWISKAYFEKRGKEVCIEEKYQDKIPGYIVTRDAEKNGRPIAWIFPGSTRKRDGSRISAEELASFVDQSANYQLLRKGLVYPYFYMTLPAKVREKLAEATQLAQADAEQLMQSLEQHQEQSPDKLPNLWVYDQMASGVKITHVSQLADEYEIWPYLFRKILKHWHKSNMEGYWDTLRNNRPYDPNNEEKVTLKGFFGGGNPYLLVASEKNFLKLDEILQIKGNVLKMLKHPWDLVFLS